MAAPIVSSLIAKGTALVTSLIGGLFGKTPTKKKLEALEQQAAYYAQVDQKQSQTVTFLMIGLGVAAVLLVVVILRRRR